MSDHPALRIAWAQDGQFGEFRGFCRNAPALSVQKCGVPRKSQRKLEIKIFPARIGDQSRRVTVQCQEKTVRTKVMSRGLCKNAEGAIFPFQVKALEDGVNDPVHAFYVHKADHRPGSSAHLHETTLDDVGGAQFLPQMFGKV